MKNVSKLLLLVILAGAGYFFGVVVYGACSLAGGLICNTWELCETGWGCLCGLTTVPNLSNWGTCTPGDPAMDLNTTNILNWELCWDPDWCYCETVFKNKWESCTIVSSDITNPILSSLGVSVLNRTATFWFSSSEGPVTISCLWSCWTCSINANTWNNTITFSNLINWVYNNCSIIWQDLAGNVSTPLNIPSFTVNITWWTVGGWWGWGSSSMCSDIYLTCTNGIYTLKTGYYCAGWSLGKTCNVSLGTGVDAILEIIKEEKSVVYEYTPQWIKIRIFVPKYRQALIKKTILSLNRSLYTAINKKLLKVTDPSYMIENFENLTSDSKILVYKEIGALTKLYNDFLGILYLVLDMKQKEYLPLARTYLETYFKEFAKFQK